VANPELGRAEAFPSHQARQIIQVASGVGARLPEPEGRFDDRDDARRPVAERVTLNGPACFAGDIIYRNIAMPEVRPGEILAIMDSGAYFTALESSFGFARPAIVLVDDSEVRVIRTRETFDDMLSRDILRRSS
jgi:diaminopimelate decarboxylase